MRTRSPKMARLYRRRRLLVEQLLAERPWCQIHWDQNCQGRSVDVDEILPRSQGGSSIDPVNCQTACRHCHDMRHANPAEAVARGLALSSWHPVLFCIGCGEDRPVTASDGGYTCVACGRYRPCDEGDLP